MSRLDEYLGLHVTWLQQWTGLFGRNNWYDFDLVHLYVEWDRMLGGVELSAVLLGLGFTLRYNYAETEAWLDIKRRAADARESWERTGDDG